MTTSTWVTIAAHDTPFLAQLVTDHLEDAGFETRLLSDSGGGNLPHISFGSGGYRVQVPSDDEAAAREALSTLREDELVGVDVGSFTDHEGVQPPVEGTGTPARGSWSMPTRILALVLAGMTIYLAMMILELVAWPF